MILWKNPCTMLQAVGIVLGDIDLDRRGQIISQERFIPKQLAEHGPVFARVLCFEPNSHQGPRLPVLRVDKAVPVILYGRTGYFLNAVRDAITQIHIGIVKFSRIQQQNDRLRMLASPNIVFSLYRWPFALSIRFQTGPAPAFSLEHGRERRPSICFPWIFPASRESGEKTIASGTEKE